MAGACREEIEHLDDEPGDQEIGVDKKKRTLGASERDERARDEYRRRVAEQPAGRFVIIDECGSNINLTPSYGWAPKGKRAYGKAPRNTEKNTTLIAAMTTRGMAAAMLLSGATDRAAFETYLERVLAPTLWPGQVVAMDNLSAHKGHRVRELIEQRGCQLWYLPSYSPDLSPIEEAFSKLKGGLRRAEARSREALEAAVAAGLETITHTDARSYFAHCGYGTAHLP